MTGPPKTPRGLSLNRPLRIGSRGSPLALWQARHAADLLRRAAPGLEVEIVTIRTAAEKFPQAPPEAIGVGIFTREIDEELLASRIDLAVHSLKDLSSELHPDLCLAAVPERGSPLDAFVGTEGGPGPSLWELPEGAGVGTGSPRRKAQVLHRRPDLRILPLRGNVETRLRKARDLGLQGTILAHAGLLRLGREGLVRHLLTVDRLVPAVGQGALAVMARADRGDCLELARRLDHGPSRRRVAAERAFLRALRGGCQAPAGALAELAGQGGGEELILTAVLAAPDGSRCLRSEARGPAAEGEEMGRKLAEDLLGRGGREILAAVRSAPPHLGDFQS